MNKKYLLCLILPSLMLVTTFYQQCFGNSSRLQLSEIVVGLDLKVDDKFITPTGEKYKVVQEINAGEDRRVFKVIRKADQQNFVLKYARTRDIPKGERGIQKELRTVIRLAELKVNHPKVLENGQDWLIREWVDGPLGLVWFERWKASGYNPQDSLWLKFYALLNRTARQGVVVGAMDLDDIIEYHEDWTVIDSGRVREMPPEEAWEFYRDDLSYSWGDKLGNSEVCKVLFDLVRPH